MALQGLPSLLVLVFVWFIPESPRWYIAQGESEKAKAILTKYVYLAIVVFLRVPRLIGEKVPREWKR